MKSIVEKNIEYLNLPNKLEKKLKDNNFNYIKDVWVLKRANLKQFLTDREVGK